MSRYRQTYGALCLCIILAGCGVNWRPSDAAKPEPPAPAVATVADSAASTARTKAAMQADVARQVAAFIRAGSPKEYADIEDFESPKNKAIGLPESTKKIYEPLRNAQDARLAKDKDGNLDLIRGMDGKPDFEATAKIWDETADGFDKIAKGK